MGRVWRATDEMLDRQVAVKEMRIDGLDPEDTRTRRERTLREARATARIDHPGVVRVYDVVDEGELLWIVMELVDGRSLERLLYEDGPLDVRETARIGLELVGALVQVHAGGVLHRDIKPANVLVERTGNHRVVLTDFGIAAIQNTEALTMVGMLVGSPDYMAPERVSGRPQGPPSDLWSLGATLCAALGGRSPFSRTTTLATLHAVLYEEPELPPTTGELREILAALLEKEPDVRPGLEELETVFRAIATATTAGQAREEEAPQVPAPEPDPEERAPEHSVRHSVPGRPAPQSTPAPHPPTLVNPSEPEAASAPEPVRTEEPGSEPVPRQPVDPATHDLRPEPLTPDAQLPDRATTPVLNREAAPPLPGTPESPYASQRPAVGENPDPGPQGEPPSSLPTRPRPTPTPPGDVPQSPGPRRRRRIALVAAAGVVLAGAVAGLVVPSLGGSPGGGDDTDGGSPGVKSSPSPSPGSTVEGTSRPPSPTLPPGSRTESGVFSWVPPDGFSREVHAGAEVHYTSPDGRQEIVGKASLARGDLMTQWEETERSTSEGAGYERIRLEESTFRGMPAVVWEYRVTAQELPWRVRSLGFNTNGKSYQLTTWYHPDVEDRALPVYEAVEKSFRPL
ncbi:protein kinase domain-containing protein [Streptomyces graminofaciens]